MKYRDSSNKRILSQCLNNEGQGVECSLLLLTCMFKFILENRNSDLQLRDKILVCGHDVVKFIGEILLNVARGRILVDRKQRASSKGKCLRWRNCICGHAAAGSLVSLASHGVYSLGYQRRGSRFDILISCKGL